MGKKKNQRKNSVKMPSYKNTEEMLLSRELADICGLEAGYGNTDCGVFKLQRFLHKNQHTQRKLLKFGF